jgi:hypothetical protein
MSRGVSPTRRGLREGSWAVALRYPQCRPRARARQEAAPNTTALLAVVNGALVGVGSVYLTTHSVLVTLMAAVSSVILGALALLVR